MIYNIKNPINLKRINKISEILHATDFVLLNTGWDAFWGKDMYFNNFPIPKAEVFRSLSEFNLKGIGIDTISIDPINSKDLPNHHILLEKEILIIENLTNLSKLSNTEFEFYCFPLPITKGDGSPVRAVAKL